MAGKSTFGILFIVVGILLAYLYATGKWTPIWAIITGTASSSTTNSTAVGTNGNGVAAPSAASFGTYTTPATNTPAVPTPTPGPTPSPVSYANPAQTVDEILGQGVASAASPMIAYSLGAAA